MGERIKYIGMWSFFWLQIYLIFLHITTFMYIDAFTIGYEIGAIIFVGAFITYQAMYTLQKMSMKQISRI